MPIKRDGLDGNNAYDNQYTRMYPSEAITAGNFVSLDLSDTTWGIGNSVRPSDTDDVAGGDNICGVAVETVAAAAAEGVQVQVRGFYSGALTTGVAIGAMLVPHTTDGTAQTASAATETHVGIALTATTGGVSDVLLIDPYNLSPGG